MVEPQEGIPIDALTSLSDRHYHGKGSCSHDGSRFRPVLILGPFYPQSTTLGPTVRLVADETDGIDRVVCMTVARLLFDDRRNGPLNLCCAHVTRCMVDMIAKPVTAYNPAM